MALTWTQLLKPPRRASALIPPHPVLCVQSIKKSLWLNRQNIFPAHRCLLVSPTTSLDQGTLSSHLNNCTGHQMAFLLPLLLLYNPLYCILPAVAGRIFLKTHHGTRLLQMLRCFLTALKIKCKSSSRSFMIYFLCHLSKDTHLSVLQTS